MNKSRSFTEQELRELVISAAYNDVSFKQRMYVWHLLNKYPKYRALYNEYKQTAKLVHKMKLEDCPADIENAAFEYADQNKTGNQESSISILFGRPAAAAVISVIILAAVLFTMDKTKKPAQIERQYTQQELTEAEKQVKMSLRIVHEVFNKTTKKIGEEIIPQKVGKPLKQGIDIINQIFPKGAKSDEKS